MPSTHDPAKDPPPGQLAERTLDRWLGVNTGASKRGAPTTTSGWDGVRHRAASPATRARRFLKTSRDDPAAHWSEKLLVIFGWVAIVAVLVMLAYLVYRGLQVGGVI